VDEALESVLIKRLLPQMRREMRKDLTLKSEAKSIEIFSENLKKLLLMPPITGRVCDIYDVICDIYDVFMMYVIFMMWFVIFMMCLWCVCDIYDVCVIFMMCVYDVCDIYDVFYDLYMIFMMCMWCMICFFYDLWCVLWCTHHKNINNIIIHIIFRGFWALIPGSYTGARSLLWMRRVNYWKTALYIHTHLNIKGDNLLMNSGIWYINIIKTHKYHKNA